MLVNKEEGIKLSYDSQDLYNEIIAAYIEESVEYKNNLEKFLEDKNWKEYTVVIHAIKSNSKQIGAEGLYEKALNLETAGKSGDENYIYENHNIFLEEYENVLNEIS